MPKLDRAPESPAFVATMARIKEISGATTQVQLADVLDIRQSSISDAKRRQTIPDGWLVKLLRSHGVLPDWVLTGQGQQYLHSTPEIMDELAIERILNDCQKITGDTFNVLRELSRQVHLMLAKRHQSKAV